MAINTYSDITSFVTTIFEDAMFVARENNLMAPLVTQFSGQGMADRKVQVYGTGTVASIGETDDLASQSFTPTALSTLSPGEVGLQFFLTDQRLESDPFGVRSDAAAELGAAMAAKIESDLLGKFSSLTAGTVGQAGSTITWAKFFAMESILRKSYAPPPYVCVLHPYQWWRLANAASIAATTQPASPAFQDEVTRRYFVGNVGGVDIFTSGNISVDASDDAYCAMFARPAIALDTRRAPRLETERDASRRGWELNMTAVYAYGTWRPAFGVTGVFDAATPS